MATVRFIGVGNMGGPIAANLVAAAEYRLRGFAAQRTTLALRRTQ